MQYHSVQEKDLVIDLSDGKRIHGYLRGKLENVNGVIVMMHGLTGSPKSVLQYLGSRYLHEQGFSTLCLAMYDVGESYRTIFDCDINVHIRDFEEVVAHLQKSGVKKIFGVGHSYGGLTILGSKAKVSGAVLWDPTHGLAFEHDNSDKFPHVTYGPYRIDTSGKGYVYPEAIAKYNESLGDNSLWAEGKGYPIKFIAAGGGVLKDSIKKYLEIADEPKSYIEIEGASHDFTDTDAIITQLFVETAGWFHNLNDDK